MMSKIPIYIAKKFKILLKTIDIEKPVFGFFYVNELSKKELDDLSFILKAKVILEEKLDETMFNIHLRNIYENEVKDASTHEYSNAVAVPPTVNNDEIPVSQDLTVTDFLKTVPMDLLEFEIKRRYLEKNLIGQVTIDENVTFKFDEVKWPKGSYKVSVSFIEEIRG
jgi:hypothetical protein